MNLICVNKYWTSDDWKNAKMLEEIKIIQRKKDVWIIRIHIIYEQIFRNSKTKNVKKER